MKKLITMLAVLGMVFALAPAAQADTLYTENFVGTGSPLRPLSDIGWEGNQPDLQTVANAGGVATPDGDGWYARQHNNNNGPRVVYTSERPILAAERVDTKFIMDWASSHNDGMCFIAEVDGTWYGTDIFGTDITDYTLITVNSSDTVAIWVTDQTVDVETANWYEWTGGTFPPANHPEIAGMWSATPEPLPAGVITQFGSLWNMPYWGTGSTVDNFRVVAGTPTPPGTLMLVK
jgi:hypothetical protein